MVTYRFPISGEVIEFVRNILSFGRGDLADYMIELVIRVSVIRVQESHGNGYAVRHDHRTPSDCSDIRVKENSEEA